MGTLWLTMSKSSIIYLKNEILNCYTSKLLFFFFSEILNVTHKQVFFKKIFKKLKSWTKHTSICMSIFLVGLVLEDIIIVYWCQSSETWSKKQ